MRKRFLATLVAAVLTIAGGIVAATPTSASPADGYTGTHFGLGNIPPGCEGDTFLGPDGQTPRTDNACYHMRTGMNGLDSSNVDVLIMVPASPTASRDMRIIKQAVEMWQGGIHYLAPQMGVPWMKNMKFHISTDIESAENGGGFVTYPVVDPEIVIVASNPAGGVGIGIDPMATYGELLTGNGDTPCTGVSNPFDMNSWKGKPGYDHHANEPGATVTEDCPNGGGNICFALTPAIDPAPPALDVFNLFDLVAHEFGHCLTVGHVGDGAEAQTEGGPWSKVATNDIMSYNTDPPGLNKCVSTLDVEGIAVTQSHYIDTNGDHVVNAADHVDANENDWDIPNGDHFQVQNPRDEFYASDTGAVTRCPQPDLGLLPGKKTNWEPNQTPTTVYNLNVTGPSDGATAADGNFNVLGTVERASAIQPPSNTSGVVYDSQSDANTDYTEIKRLNVATTPTMVTGKIVLKALPPTGVLVTSPTSYSLEINGRRFDSFIRYPQVDTNPMTWDNGAGAYMPAGTSKWTASSKTISFSIPRSYLSGVNINAPYFISSSANFGILSTEVVDDRAPDGLTNTVGVAGSKSPSYPSPTFRLMPHQALDTVTFNNPGGNTFFPEQSTAGVLTGSPADQSHHFTLDVPNPSEVTFTLNWTDDVGGADLDLHVSGAADSGTTAASSNKPEVVTFPAVHGHLDIAVEPYLVTDEVNGSTYTLTAQINTGTVTDGDGDGTPDSSDACPTVYGTGPDGCPLPAPALEKVSVYVDGVLAGSQDVDTSGGADNFAIPVTVPVGNHTLRIDWSYFGTVRASTTKQVTH